MPRFESKVAAAAAIVYVGSILVANGQTLGKSADAPVTFAEGDGRLSVIIDGLPVAVYCYQGEKITRPFFAHVRARNGRQVTRQHPPVKGQDLLDHDAMHPGIWMSFGDIDGSDYWRLKAPVRHVRFAQLPHGGSGKGSFTVQNEFLAQHDASKIVCEEIAHYTFKVVPEGYLLLWDSTFSSTEAFAFGDQEEMGLAFRVATPLRVEDGANSGLPAGNGTIRDSEGRMNGRKVWGNSANWCDYSGTLAGERVGIAILCHPDNFRPSWFHARDSGLLAANPFGRAAFGKGATSSVVIRPGQKLRLQYGVLIHAGPSDSYPDLEYAYSEYVESAGN